MRNIFKYSQLITIVIIAMLYLWTSCENNNDNYSSYTEDVAVNGFLSPQDTFRVNLSYIKNIWGYRVDSFITDADIELILPDQKILKLEYDSMKSYVSNKKQGFYKATELIPYSQGHYTLKIELADNKVIFATDSLPHAATLTEYKYFFDTINNKYQLQLQFQDNKEKIEYYSISLSITNFQGFYQTKHDNFGISSPNTFIEAPIWGPLNQFVFTNKSFEPGIQNVDINLDGWTKNHFANLDSIQFNIKLHSISKAYYDYAISFYKQNQAEKDFYAEPVSVFSNIDGGYGIFAGFNTVEAKIIFIRPIK